MNLIGEQFVPNKPDKTKKTRKIILALIIIVIIAIIAVIISLMLLKEEKTSITLNGVESAELKNILRIEENNKIHIPIRDIASLLGYESYNGNYINRSEDTNECYIETNEEVVMFKVGSNKIEKISTSNQEVTYFYIDEPVAMIEGKLYTTPDGISQSYNVNFKYDENLKNISIESMQYLIELYKNPLIEYGFQDVSTKFNDIKAILNNLVIVKDSKGQYGIFDVKTDKTILETKYSSIKYIPVTKDFFVESNGKIGIKESDGTDKIKIQYDSIELINQDLKLYVVKKEGKYGVINQSESVIIPINCDSIGIDAKTFSANGIKNKYVILDKIVPVMRNNLWGLYDIEGNGLAKYQYNSFGCTSSSVRNTENVLVIPDYNIIIGCKDKKYYLINQYGQELLNSMAFDEVYMEKDLDEVRYWLIKDKTKYNALELLEKLQQSTNISSNETNQENDNEQEENVEEQNTEETYVEEQNTEETNEEVENAEEQETQEEEDTENSVEENNNQEEQIEE